MLYLSLLTIMTLLFQYNQTKLCEAYFLQFLVNFFEAGNKIQTRIGFNISKEEKKH